MRRRKSCSRTTAHEFAAPISTGPPAPLSIRLTRRRMSARVIRSPSSASAISSDRTPSGKINSVSTSSSAVASTSAGAVGELPDLGQELTGALLGDGRDMAQAVALGDRHCAREDHKHAGRRLAGLEQLPAAGVFAQSSEAAQPLDLARGQSWKGLIVARAVCRIADGGRSPRAWRIGLQNVLTGPASRARPAGAFSRLRVLIVNRYARA